METRSRDDAAGESFSMRSKEEAHDYRYFPEPDLPPLKIDEDTLQKIDETQIEIPHRLIKKFKEEYGFHKEYINTLIGNKIILDYFLDILKQTNNDTLAKDIAKRISGPISAYLKENFIEIDALKFDKNQFIAFLHIAQEGKILDNQLKEVMDDMLNTGANPEEIIKEKGFDAPAVDDNELEEIIKKILAENPDTVEKYNAGKTSVI